MQAIDYLEKFRAADGDETEEPAGGDTDGDDGDFEDFDDEDAEDGDGEEETDGGDGGDDF